MTTEEASQDHLQPTQPQQLDPELTPENQLELTNHFDDDEEDHHPLDHLDKPASEVEEAVRHEDEPSDVDNLYDEEFDDDDDLDAEDVDDDEEDQEEPADAGDQGEESPTSSERPEVQLAAITEAAKSARLTAADEDRAIQLLKQTVPSGPKALPATLDAILSLPWSLGVRAVTEVWPDTKPAGRTRLLTGLAKADSDVSRRIRLSLARGLHAQDPASAFKLLLGVCEAMGGAAGGSSTKDRQIFANVMLGKARPWLMNVAMADMKPAEAQKLITPALESCHQAPIFTQIWVLRWICDAGKFETLPPEHIDSIGKSINRWQPRWKKELRKIIPKLPEPLEAVLVDSHHRGPVPGPTAPAGESDLAAKEQEAGEEPTAEAAGDGEAREIDPAQELRQIARSYEAAPRSRDRDRDRDRDRQPAQGPFDLNRSLRDIEAYVSRLRADLQQAQMAARRREPAPDRRRMSAAPASVEELDELRRHNLQIEARNQELIERIEELTNDHEDRASTLEISEPLEQFKTFLGLKLKEDFADYTAISRESLTEVVRRHAHEILGRVFEVLKTEGVNFEKKD